MDREGCPNCQGRRVIDGSFVSVNLNPSFFAPRCAQPTVASGVFPQGNRARCCLGCGHAWTTVDPAGMRSYLAYHGDELIRQMLDRLEYGPAHDLPDLPEAHEAARKAAEIDVLVLDGRQAEATKRFREVSGTTWDRALEVLRTWRDLKRAPKLALFGWQAKDVAVAHLSGSTHPMSDPWLDGQGGGASWAG